MNRFAQEIPSETTLEPDLRPAAAGVARLAQRMLWESRYSALRGVVCDEFGGVIRLGGRVPSQYLKQVAFAVVDQVVGARPIVNEIQVVAGSCDSRGVPGESSGSGWFRMTRSV
jgi:hypothetical protein